MTSKFYLFDSKGNKKIRNRISLVFGPIIFILLLFYFAFIFIFKTKIYCVFTYGKSASTSLLRAISDSGNTALQLHYITVSAMLKECKANFFSNKRSIPLHLYVSASFRLASLLTAKSKLKFILILREDPKRWLSDYLQNLDVYGKIDFTEEDWKKRLNTIQQFLNERYKAWDTTEKNYILNNFTEITILDYRSIDLWQHQLKETLGLDVKLEWLNNAEDKYYSDYKNELLQNLINDKPRS